MTSAVSVPPDVRAAIVTFLNESQREARPFALSQALSAVRRVFPDLESSDAELADAITSEALTAGIDIDFDVPTLSRSTGRKAEQLDFKGVETQKARPPKRSGPVS